MCILKDGSMCPLLSPEEMRAQHNFEERKGSYPKALADRLHETDIMTREEHFRQSLLRRKENVESQVRNRYMFSVRMDCSDEERAFMVGNRHDLPLDIFLPSKLANEMLEKFTEVRKERFRRYLCGYGDPKHAAFLLSYPEFEEWFAEFSPSMNSHSRNLQLMLDALLEDLYFLERLTRTVSEPLLRAIVARLCYRFFKGGVVVRDARVMDILTKCIPEQHRVHFEQIRRSWEFLNGPLEGISSRRVRRQRKILRKKLGEWTFLFRDDKSITRDSIEHLVNTILDARRGMADELAPALAA